MCRNNEFVIMMLCAGLLLCSPLNAGEGARTSKKGLDWPQWRGPDRNGVCLETGWTTTWPEGGPKRLWEIPVGPANNMGGSSGIAVSRGRVFTFGNKEIICVDAETGKMIWTHPSGRSHSTPTIDGDTVFVYGQDGVFKALAFQDGKVLWEKDMKKDLGAGKDGKYGYAASPLVIGERVIGVIKV